jgi:hypothetical protein
MTPSGRSRRLWVVTGFVLVALGFSWPLPLHLTTHLTGDPGGDTGVYVWNQWTFLQEMMQGGNPLQTRRIFSLSQPADLSQHNYTAFLNVLALPLIPRLGVVGAFNVVMLLMSVINALSGYVLARLAFPTTRLEAFAGGVAFAWAPALVARRTGHFSLAAAAPLAIFVWCLIKADRTRQHRYAAGAGLSMAWAAFCDPYFAVFCLLITAIYVAGQAVQLQRRAQPSTWRWFVNVGLLAVTGLVAGIALGGGGRIALFGTAISLRSLYTPVLLLTVLFLLRLALSVHVQVQIRVHARWLVHFAVVAGVASIGPLAPVLYGLGQRVADGRFVSPPTLWRSSPRGVDLLALFHPNPNHPLSRHLLGDLQSQSATAFVEYTAALSLVALAVVLWAVWRVGFRPRASWWWVTAGFAALALGPFVIIGGANSYIPGPWALLRYLPVVSIVRTPTRFAIVAALGLAMLLAGALVALGERWPHRRRRIGWAVLALLLFELLPAPRPLYSAQYPDLLTVIADDPRPVRVLNLPFGVRDGAQSVGNFSARSQFNQTRHGKPLIGGYLSRVSERRITQLRERFPVLSVLMRLSEGQPLTEDDRTIVMTQGATFVADASVGYVLIDRSSIPDTLSTLAVSAFDLEHVATEGQYSLYRPGQTLPSPDIPR